MSFGNKRTLLAQLVDRAVGGDDEPMQILDRPGPQQVKSEPDQRRQLHMFARDMADIMERVGPLFGVMRAAATTVPEIAALLESLLSARRENIGVFVRWLTHNGPLRPELSESEVTDTVWTLTSAEVHHLWPSIVGGRRNTIVNGLAIPSFTSCYRNVYPHGPSS